MVMIVPCCGESQRYKGTKKQFLKLPNGLPLPVFSASGIKGANRIIYTFIGSEFMQNYDAGNVLWNGELCLLPHQTVSQVHTIEQTIISLGLQRRGIYIKDCDNYFNAQAWPNVSTVAHTQNLRCKLGNKSFTSIDKNGNIKNIAERTEISQYINVGGYGFASGEMFLTYSPGKKYISEVIVAAIAAGLIFNTNSCENYIDYGEQDDYDKFLLAI